MDIKVDDGKEGEGGGGEVAPTENMVEVTDIDRHQGAINRPRNVREKVQTWMTGIVTEVKRKSPSMVHRWVSSSGEQQESLDSGTEINSTGKLKEDVEEEVKKPEERGIATGLRSTIKSKLSLNELYDKLSKSRDIAGLFRPRNKTMESPRMLHSYAENENYEEEEEGDLCSEEDSEGPEDATNNLKDEDEEVEDIELMNGIRLAKSESDTKLIGNSSSPHPHHHLNDEEFQFSFEDFSFIGTKKEPDSAVAIESQKDVTNDSGCVEKDDGDVGEEDEEVVRINVVESTPAKRRMNIGEIGRSISANPNPDCSADMGTTAIAITGGTKRHLLSDIGRRFSEMNESSDCEFQSDSLRQVKSNRSLNLFRPNSMPVSPKPRMLLPIQHRGSTDLSANKKRNSLFREYSTQSDSSRCSSVESLLESRRPDAETILINLGFGPVQSDDVLSRLPKRFLKPSNCPGIDTEEFVKQQQLATTIHEHSVLGYRGLIGNHYPPSLIVARIQERFQENEQNRMLTSTLDIGRPASAPPSPSAHV